VHFLVASGPAECAQALLRILEHPEQRRLLGDAGRKRMLTHHAWDRSMARLDRIIDRCLAGARGARNGAPYRTQGPA